MEKESNATINNNFNGCGRFSETIFEELHPLANDYLSLANKNIFLSEVVNEKDQNEILSRLSEHDFVKWINKQSGFISAREKYKNMKIVAKSDLAIIAEYKNNSALEWICAWVISGFTCKPDILKDVVAKKSRKKKVIAAVNKLKYELNLSGGILFSPESKQHLLNWLIEEILKEEEGERNVYSSGITHAFQQRELFIKEIIKAMLVAFGSDINHSLVTEMALDITSVFFSSPMDRGEAIDLTRGISENIVSDNLFQQKSIRDILFEEGLKKSKQILPSSKGQI